MATKIEVIKNYLLITDTTTGETWEVARDDFRYNDKGSYFTFYDKRRIEPQRDVLFTDIVDYQGLAYSSVGDFLDFLREKTGATRSSQLIANETNIVAQYLTNGASFDQAVDGSVTPVEFSYSPPAGYEFICARIIFFMEGSTAFDATTFGDLPALTNGWTIEMNGVEAMAAKDNKDLGTYMYDMTGDAIYGKPTKIIIGRFSFNRFTDGAEGATIREGESFKTIVKDNLSGLVILEAKIMGVLNKK